jgi:hypothetical protein
MIYGRRLGSAQEYLVMTMRHLFLALAALAALPASAALAADLPEGPPPRVVYAPPPDDANARCRWFGEHRQVDHVWQPGQVAYIVAQTCGQTTSWLERIGQPNWQNILVYYNGGSMYRTDIRTLNVPIRSIHSR